MDSLNLALTERFRPDRITTIEGDHAFQKQVLRK